MYPQRYRRSDLRCPMPSKFLTPSHCCWCDEETTRLALRPRRENRLISSRLVFLFGFFFFFFFQRSKRTATRPLFEEYRVRAIFTKKNFKKMPLDAVSAGISRVGVRAQLLSTASQNDMFTRRFFVRTGFAIFSRPLKRGFPSTKCSPFSRVSRLFCTVRFHTTTPNWTQILWDFCFLSVNLLIKCAVLKCHLCSNVLLTFQYLLMSIVFGTYLYVYDLVRNTYLFDIFTAHV